MIGEEFVPRLKTEPEQEDDIAVPSDSVNRPSVVMSVPQEQVASLSAASDQPNLVYCNLNDLDLEAGAGEPVPVLTAGGQNIIGDQVDHNCQSSANITNGPGSSWTANLWG